MLVVSTRSSGEKKKKTHRERCFSKSKGWWETDGCWTGEGKKKKKSALKETTNLGEHKAYSHTSTNTNLNSRRGR